VRKAGELRAGAAGPAETRRSRAEQPSTGRHAISGGPPRACTSAKPFPRRAAQAAIQTLDVVGPVPGVVHANRDRIARCSRSSRGRTAASQDPPSPAVASHRIASHRIASHRVASRGHANAQRRGAERQPRGRCFARSSATDLRRGVSRSSTRSAAARAGSPSEIDCTAGWWVVGESWRWHRRTVSIRRSTDERGTQTRAASARAGVLAEARDERSATRAGSARGPLQGSATCARQRAAQRRGLGHRER